MAQLSAEITPAIKSGRLCAQKKAEPNSFASVCVFSLNLLVISHLINSIKAFCAK